jgi:hypothetical protein
MSHSLGLPGPHDMSIQKDYKLAGTVASMSCSNAVSTHWFKSTPRQELVGAKGNTAASLASSRRGARTNASGLRRCSRSHETKRWPRGSSVAARTPGT